MAADYPDPLPESTAPMPRLRLLARSLLMIYSWSWNGTLVLKSNSSVPKASTALDSSCSHFDLAELEDLLPLGSWMRLVLDWHWLPSWVIKCLGS
jgi:hypothetical protein